jgi:hypothetical protein
MIPVEYSLLERVCCPLESSLEVVYNFELILLSRVVLSSKMIDTVGDYEDVQEYLGNYLGT